MLLRTATEKDKPALLALWQSAFGDTAETVETFFALCFSPENTLVAETDGGVRAALYLLDSALYTKEKTFRASYIYAAATEKAYRKKGLMRALLQYAKNLCSQRGVDFLFLTPATEDLFAYYGKCGFFPAFAKTEYTATRAELSAAADSATHLQVCKASVPAARETALQGVPHIVWGENACRFQQYLEKTFGVQSVYTNSGFAVFETENGICTVSEFCASPQNAPALFSELLKNSTANAFCLSAPCAMDLPLKNTGKIQKTAMLSPLSVDARAVALSQIYIGITLA